jgi:hypothetical protein
MVALFPDHPLTNLTRARRSLVWLENCSLRDDATLCQFGIVTLTDRLRQITADKARRSVAMLVIPITVLSCQRTQPRGARHPPYGRSNPVASTVLVWFDDLPSGPITRYIFLMSSA